MTTILFVVAIVAAIAAMAYRRLQKQSRQKAALHRDGASPDNPIYIRSFNEMDDHMRKRWCSCGGFLEVTGEGTRERDGRRFRVARMECHECEESSEVFFDTTDLLQ
ncbi:MAG: hypothetical protein P8R42_29620 [Candidatus Binatia bacterium]|nr:hypothetical protein [Candidatus Binatia bacterium]